MMNRGISRLSCLFFAASAAGLAGLVAASPSASSFVLGGEQGNNNLSFSINVADNSDDLYFRLEGPIGNSWIAVGTGDQMAGSLMFVVYAAQSAGNVTLSPRLGTGHIEPSFSEDINIHLLDGSGIYNSTYVVRAVCHNCRQWNGGSLNVNTTYQPWIYAVGPGRPFASDSMTASLGLHSSYGEFTINMTHATGTGGVPDPATTMSGAASVGGTHTSYDYPKLFHALFMSGVFICLYPFAVICARIFGWIKFHAINMVFATILAFIAFFLAVYMSTLYSKSRHWNTPHQIIGSVVMAGIVVQLTLGFIFHRQRAEERTPRVRAHNWIGQGILLLGIVNGGIGFNFGGAGKTPIILYSFSAIAVMLLYSAMFYFKSCWTRHKKEISNMAEEDGYNAHYLSDMVPAPPEEAYQPQEPPRPYH